MILSNLEELLTPTTNNKSMKIQEKKIIIAHILLVFFSSCVNSRLKEDNTNEFPKKETHITKNCDIKQLYYNIKKSNQTLSNMVIDTLNNYDLDCIKKFNSDSGYKNLCAVFFLKANLSHLRTANQSFNVVNRCKGESSKMLKLYEPAGEGGKFLPSGAIYEQILKDTSFIKSPYTNRLLDSIAIETKRIIKQTTEIINSE